MVTTFTDGTRLDPRPITLGAGPPQPLACVIQLLYSFLQKQYLSCGDRPLWLKLFLLYRGHFVVVPLPLCIIKILTVARSGIKMRLSWWDLRDGFTSTGRQMYSERLSSEGIPGIPRPYFFPTDHPRPPIPPSITSSA